MITPEQCRAARALLNWTQTDLAKRAGVTQRTIAQIEGGKQIPLSITLNAIEQALREGGVRFIEHKSGVTGPGVALKEKS